MISLSYNFPSFTMLYSKSFNHQFTSVNGHLILFHRAIQISSKCREIMLRNTNYCRLPKLGGNIVRRGVVCLAQSPHSIVLPTNYSSIAQTVLILGRSGADEASLYKYSKIYTDYGAIQISSNCLGKTLQNTNYCRLPKLGGNIVRRGVVCLAQSPPSIVLPTNYSSIPQTVLILGRSGADEASLYKYSKIYTDYGLPTVRFTIPYTCHDASTADIEPIGELIATAIKGKSRLIVQSNGSNGIRAYLAMLEYSGKLDKNGPRALVQAIDGLVMDSCPFDVGIREFSQTSRMAVNRQLYSDSLYTKSKTALVLGVLNAKYALRRTIGTARSVSGHVDENEFIPNTVRLRDKMPYNQLYIYSTRDMVADYRDIEAFAREQKALLNKVEKVRFVVSSHCKHYHDYAAEYQAAVWNFLRKMNVDKQKSVEGR